MNSQEFLDALHGPDALIYFNVAGRTWKSKPQTFRQAESKLRWRNDLGEDICFIVNSGGTRDSQISQINAVFIDWDCGRDDAGSYFPDNLVRVKKDQFLPTLLSFTPAASIIVETRNGFHAYWLLNPGVTVDQFREAQRRLAQRFQGDTAVTNPARVMRLPGFDWVKPSSGCPRFQVGVLSSSNIRYAVEDVLEAIPEAKTNLEDQSDGKSAHNKCECLSSLALIVGANPVSLPSVADAIEYLKNQDLGTYISGIDGTPDAGQNLLCPFHADTNPSAGVFRARATGHWLFKCHVCNFAGTILDIAMRIHRCTQGDALKHLFGQYQITIDTGWKDQQQSILQQNLAVISNTNSLRETYPCLFRLIGRVRVDLKSKIELARDYLVSERSQAAGRPVFFSSLRHFHHIASGRTESPRYCNRQNEKVDRYCLLGLMRKLPDAEVPPALLKDAVKRKFKQMQKYRIQFFSIPAYTTERLEGANNRACKLISAGVSVRGISPELIGSLFGNDVVREIYPQLQHTEPSSAQVAFRIAVEQAVVLAVARKGYTTTKEIRASMQRQDEWASVTARRIEKYLPGLLIKLKLRKRTCDKQLKQRLRIGGTGFPKVIIPMPQAG